MKFLKSNKEKGFTLIELLVVVAIISLLTSVVLASLNEAKERAKGTAFRQEVNELIKAIELYKLDHGGDLPLVFEPDGVGYFYYFYEGTGDATINSIPSENNDFINKLSPYLKEMPHPPFSEKIIINIGRTYRNSSTGDWMKCSNETGPSPDYFVSIRSEFDKTESFFKDWKEVYDFESESVKCFSL